MKCSDPYKYGCENEAVYHRPKAGSDRQDYPKYLCEECFEAMIEQTEGIKWDFKEEEWQVIQTGRS